MFEVGLRRQHHHMFHKSSRREMVTFLTVPRTASQKSIFDSVLEVRAGFWLSALPPLPPPRKNWPNKSREVRSARAAEIESAKIEMRARLLLFRRSGRSALGWSKPNWDRTFAAF